MAVLMPIGIIVQRKVFLGFYIAATIFLVGISLATGFAVRPSVWSAPAVVYCFFTGVVFFQWREIIPLNKTLLLVSLLGVALMFREPSLCFATAIPLTYVVTYIGCIGRLALPMLKGRDYSYGIYLYGFPITQAIVALDPNIGRYGLFASAFIATLAFAALSWHWIEKPFLRLKR